MDSGYTHVVEYDGGAMVDQITRYPDRNRFLSPLRRRNGDTRRALTLWPLPEGMSYDDAEHLPRTTYLQAAGTADALMVDIRKPGGAQWGCESVRYFVGHSSTPAPLDVPIKLPQRAEMVSADEVFGADEAADLFLAYQQTGDLPPGYALRPVECYRADGSIVAIADTARQ